jgi:hypothetical protein
MVVLPCVKDAKECNQWGVRLSQEISGIKPGGLDWEGNVVPEGRPGLFKAPLAMEFEKAMRMLCLKKKKYAAYLIGKKGTFEEEDIYDKKGEVVGSKKKMLTKGIVLARRDNCQFLRVIYTKILSMIMDRRPLLEAINALIDAVQELLDGKVAPEQLTTIRELGANYKSNSFFMKVFSDRLQKTGKIVNPGDRLDFVIVEDKTATLLGHKMRLLEQYYDKLNTPEAEKIDYNYYIEKALMNPINQLFELGFKDEIAGLRDVGWYLPSNRHKPIYLDRPLQIILKMLERKKSLIDFRDWVHHIIYYKATVIVPPKLTLNINKVGSMTENAVTTVDPLVVSVVPVVPVTPFIKVTLNIMPAQPSIIPKVTLNILPKSIDLSTSTPKPYRPPTVERQGVTPFTAILNTSRSEFLPLCAMMPKSQSMEKIASQNAETSILTAPIVPVGQLTKPVFVRLNISKSK